jgi:UDP:flavonoid glycosyltransferase YjiC (YdhE family)
MKTVLVAWELGGGLGHVMRASALATSLMREGARVVVALADLADCARVTWPGEVVLIAAPRPHRRPQGFANASSYGELLYGAGYHDLNQLTGLVTAWGNLIELSGADLLVADHAPSAQLAAKMTGVPMARIGSGFFAPPPGAVTPIYRKWESVDAARAEATERHVLEITNLVGAGAGVKRFCNLSEALAPDLDLVASWPELDCYADLRPAGSVLYVGNEYVSAGASQLQWPLPSKGDRARVFAYLKGAYPAISRVLKILGGEFETVAYVSGLNSEQRRHLAGDGLCLTDGPISFERAAVEADALVCHGGAGTAPWFLAAGKPVLLLPYSAEQLVNARQIEQTGAGRVVLADFIAKEFASALNELTRESAASSAARCLASRWLKQPDASRVAAQAVLGLR